MSFWLGNSNVGAGIGAGSVRWGTLVLEARPFLSIGEGCIVSKFDSDSEELELRVVSVRSSGVALGATCTGEAFLLLVVESSSSPILTLPRITVLLLLSILESVRPLPDC